MADASGLIPVASYSMYNGGVGSYDYWDTTYLPCPINSCNTTGSFLSGGTGQLTNGVDSTRDWNLGYPEQWVGWYEGETNGANPLVTFYFSGPVTVHSIDVWFDNTLGLGGVGAPSQILVDGSPYVPPQNTYGPQGFTISGLDLTGNSVNVQFDQGPQPWVFIGQVTFNGTVPEPGTMLLLAVGMLGLLGGMAKRQFCS
jgi:hypothetical protein